MTSLRMHHLLLVLVLVKERHHVPLEAEGAVISLLLHIEELNGQPASRQGARQAAVATTPRQTVLQQRALVAPVNSYATQSFSPDNYIEVAYKQRSPDKYMHNQ